jgi:Cdc6-like AAA superfamily ATPase
MKKMDKKYEEIDDKELSLLGRERFFNILKTEIINYQDDIRVAIDGSWGTGKTIFLKKLIDDLKQKDGIFPVYIDAWQNDYFENPLLTMIVQLKTIPEFAEEFFDRLEKYKIKNFHLSINVGLFGVSQDFQKSGKELLDVIEQSTYIINVLSEAINMTMQKSNKKIVLVIDELDRCKPDFAVRFI